MLNLKEILEKHKLWYFGQTDGQRANLRSAYLHGADLQGTDLQRAHLQGADLQGAKGIELTIARTRVVPPEGEVICWKKCMNNVIVKLLVPKEAKRSNAFGRKCRADFVQVLEVIGADFGISCWNNAVEYHVGETVKCDVWNENYQVECGGGIHFYITREEAEAHNLR